MAGKHKLVRTLKKLSILDTTIRDYFSGFPQRAGQRARITPKFVNAQRKIASALAIRRSQSFGWAPPPGEHDTDAVLVRAGTGVILSGPGGKPVTAMGRIFYDTFDPIGIEDARTFVTGNEGNKPWMYGDGGGNVTIGFGHLVENLGEALEINFVNKHTSAPATDLEIAHDFEAAEAGTSAYAPDYEEDALLHLATGEDSRLFGADFPVHLKIADEFFPLEDLPTEVQVALFDLAFQVGGGGIGGDPRGLHKAEYPRLHRALRRRDWGHAGEQMDVNKPIVTARRNADRWDKAKEAHSARSFFTTEEPQFRSLLDDLLRP